MTDAPVRRDARTLRDLVLDPGSWTSWDIAVPQRARAIGLYQRSQAARRSPPSRSPMPSTRTSLPGAAVVARSNRCSERRWSCAPRS